MTTLNRYHSSGRRYSFTEFTERMQALKGRYIHVVSRVHKPNPYDKGHNAHKRLHRALHGVRK